MPTNTRCHHPLIRQGDGEAAPSPARPHVYQSVHGPDVLSSASSCQLLLPISTRHQRWKLRGDKGSTQVPAHSHGFQAICVSVNFSYLLLLYVLLFCFFLFSCLPADFGLQHQAERPQPLNLCEIKVIFLWQDQRYLNKKSSLPFGLPSPLTVHCVSAIGITQTSPISRTTGSATKSNILPASTRRLLKRCTPAPPSMGSRDSLAGHLDLDHVNCQSHIIWGSSLVVRFSW